MVKKTLIFLLTGLIFAGWQAPSVYAEVVIKVRALNPLNTAEMAVIKYSLPKKVSEEDIIKQNITYSMDHSEDEVPPKQVFKISYDEKKGELYVDDEIQLLPKEVVTLEVHVNDVWIIEASQIEALKQEVDGLLKDWEAQLSAVQGEGEEGQEGEVSDEGDTGEEGPGGGEELAKQEETKEFALVMKGEIMEGLDEILDRQRKNSILEVGVERHITAYEDNIEDLRQVQQDIVLLANLIQFEGEEAGEVQEGEEETETREGPDETVIDLPDMAQEGPAQDTDAVEDLASDDLPF